MATEAIKLYVRLALGRADKPAKLLPRNEHASERRRGTAQSASGSEPVFLRIGDRVLYAAILFPGYTYESALIAIQISSTFRPRFSPCRTVLAKYPTWCPQHTLVPEESVETCSLPLRRRDALTEQY